MQGSVIQAEITEQVRLLKEEWRVTVEKMSKAMAEVPHSGSRMSRTELKEMRDLEQKKTRSRLEELEEQLKRLQLLEARLERKGQGTGQSHDFLTEQSRRAHTVGSGKSWTPQSYESELVAKGEVNSGEGSSFALPGAVHHELVQDTAPTGGTRRSSFSSQTSSRAIYARPLGFPSSTGVEEGPEQLRDVLRQMVRESLKSHMDAETMLPEQESSEGANNLRASATLSSYLRTPSKGSKKAEGGENSLADANICEQNTSLASAESSDAKVHRSPVSPVLSVESSMGFEDKSVGGAGDDASRASTSMNLSAENSSAVKKISFEEVETQENGAGPSNISSLKDPPRVPAKLDDAVEISCPLFFGGWNRTHPLRRACFSLNTNIFYQSFNMTITIANSIYIALAPGRKAQALECLEDCKQSSLDTALVYFDIGCCAFIAFEVLVGIIAYGFCRTRTTYVRNSGFHKLDLVVTIVTILEYLAKYMGLPNITMRPFRTLKLFKAVVRTETFAGVQRIMTTLQVGVPQFSVVLLFFLLTFAGWGLLCKSLYVKSFSRRCVNIDSQAPLCLSDFSTDFNGTCNFAKDRDKTLTIQGGGISIGPGYPYERWCKIIAVEWDENVNVNEPVPYNGEYLLVDRGQFDKGSLAAKGGFSYPKDPFGRYHSCQADIWRDLQNFTATQYCEVVGNPMGGFSHFDNFWGAVVTLSQVFLPDSSYDVWNRAKESEPWILPATLVIFMLINVFDSFILLGLFVAVVTGTFKRMREIQNAFIENNGFITDEQNAQILDLSKIGEDEEISGEMVVQYAAKHTVASRAFRDFISSVIVLNLIAIGNNSFGAEGVWSRLLYFCEPICSAMILLEMILRYIAVGNVNKFWSKNFHRLECLLIFLTFIGIIIRRPELSTLPALRGYRLLKYFPTLHGMLLSAVSSIQAIANVVVFFCIVGFCFLVSGRYIFGSKMDAITRSNFGSLGNGAITLLQLISGDSWSGVMYASMQAFPNDDYLSQFSGCLLVILWLIFANLVVKNLFVAVILENFSITDTISTITKKGELGVVRNAFRNSYTAAHKRITALSAGSVDLDVHTGMLSRRPDPFRTRQSSAQMLYNDFAVIEEEIAKQALEAQLAKNESKNFRESRLTKLLSVVAAFKPGGYQETDMDEPQRVLFCFSPNDPIRRFFVWLGKSKEFDALCLAAIICSCFFLMIEPPYQDIVKYPGQNEPNSTLVSFRTMKLCNLIFTIFFTAELTSRIMAQGLLMTKHAYLKDGWNVLDTFVVVFSLIEVSNALDELPIARLFRMARVLKPLKLMKRYQSMRIAVDALLTTLVPLSYVMAFLFFTVIIFCSIGMGLFGGKLFYCSNISVAFPDGKAECAGQWIYRSGNLNGVMMPSVWDNPYHFNFDTFADAAWSLCMTSTFKYVNIIYACMDITEIDKGPSMNYSYAFSIFFIIYILVGGLFVMNLFVAFVIDGFYAAKGSTAAEDTYRQFRRRLHNLRPKYDMYPPPSNDFSKRVRNVVVSKLFQALSTASVLVNILILLADHANPSDEFIYMIFVQDYVFFVILAIEVVLNAIAFGPLGSFNDLWRFTDLFVVIVTLVGLVSNSKAIVDFVKFFRLGRIVRLAARIKTIRTIIETLVETIPQMANIAILIFLVYSIFAVVGVQLFATTRFGQRLGPTAALDDFGSAFLLIWQIITGDEWMIIMKDLSVRPPFCTAVFTTKYEPGYQGPDRSWGDCGSSLSYLYCTSLKLVCEYIMLNLFIGLILDQFSYITEDAGHVEDVLWTNGPSEKQLKFVVSVFNIFDLGTGCVSMSQVPAILSALPLPLGYNNQHSKLQTNEDDRYIGHLLIRAELNLCMRHAMEERKKKDAWYNRYWFTRILKPRENKRIYMNEVQYEDLISVIVFWRVPSLVPDVVKWQRRERVEECMLMAYALQVKEFLKLSITRRKQTAINKMIITRKTFMHFCDQDPHRKRRNIYSSDLKVSQKVIAKANHVPVLHLLPQPDGTQNVTLNWVLASEMPEDLVLHSPACREMMVMRVPQPLTGIQVFREMVKTHDIVFKILGPHFFPFKDGLPRFLVADMRNTSWREWTCVNTKTETYFSPELFTGYDNMGRLIASRNWDRIDLNIKNPKKGRLAKRLGSIEDMQSFVVEIEAPEQKDAGPKRRLVADRAHSHLRINLGNHLYDSDKVKLQAKEWQNKQVLKNIGKNVAGILAKRLGAKNIVALLETNIHMSGNTNISDGDCILEVHGYLPSKEPQKEPAKK